VADLKPDATMKQAECWCGEFTYRDGHWWRRGYCVPVPAGAWRFCNLCASELHRKGALAGYAGPPQWAIIEAMTDLAIQRASAGMPHDGDVSTEAATAMNSVPALIAMALSTAVAKRREVPHV